MQEQRINKYNKYVVAEDFIIISNYNSVMEFPFFLRAVINTTSKEYLIDKKQSISALAAGFLLSGQKTIPTRARKSIAGFKLREGALIGCRTTLRRKKLYNILDKLLIFVLPRLYSEIKKDTIFEATSLLFLKGGVAEQPDYTCSASLSKKQCENSKASITLQTRQERVTTADKDISFFGEKGFNLKQGDTKGIKLLTQQERSQLSMHLSTFKKSNTNNKIQSERIARAPLREARNCAIIPKNPIQHLALGIKELLLMPELQEFLPFFESVRGINIGVSFYNPRIKGTCLTVTLFSGKKSIVGQNLVSYKHGFALQAKESTVLGNKVLKDSTRPHNLPKERSTGLVCEANTRLSVKHNRRRFLDTDKEHILNTFYKLSETPYSKENQKLFFLSCFQYPKK